MEVALDVGGSSIKSGLVVDGRVVDEIVTTPLDHHGTVDELVGRFAAAITSHTPTQRVAIACPAPFDYQRGISLMRHKFASLYGVELGHRITAAIGRPIETGWCNDAAAAVVGEAVAGAGRSHSRVLGITLGTGLGAAFVVGGAELVSSAGLVVGDLYQRSVDAGRIADDVFSARALMRQIADSADDELDAVMKRFGTELGRFLAPVIAALDAEVLVVGGGGIASFARFGSAVRAGLPIPVEVAQLDRAAPMIGATHLCSP